MYLVLEPFKLISVENNEKKLSEPVYLILKINESHKIYRTEQQKLYGEEQVIFCTHVPKVCDSECTKLNVDV